MTAKIERELIFVDQYNRELAALGEAIEGEDPTVSEACQEFKDKLAKAEKTIVAVDAFHSDITKHWSAMSQRVLGHIIYAPPISVGTGPKKFIEDWALIELNRDKIDWNNFKGNVMHLGTFRSTLPRSSSLTTTSRKQDFSPRLCPQDAPSP
jgi:hypothetical protein